MQPRLILTGGTIDKRYNEISENCEFEGTNITAMLAQARCNLELTIEDLMAVDSHDMTEKQRQQIVSACTAAAEDRIVIIHGTSSIVQTAEKLGNLGFSKTVVLCGAMIPYTLGNSDALFNLGAALTAVQALSYGVYVTMNGKIFTWDNVQKHVDLGVFGETLRS
jgi:L-asparaginase